MALAEISRQSSIDSVLWLLGIILRQISNEKEQAEQQEIKDIQFEEKKNTKKCNAGTKFCTQGDKKI